MLPAGRTAEGYFIASVHGVEDGNELKFGFIAHEDFDL